MSERLAEVRAELEEFVNSTGCSCIGARAALKRGSITHGHYRRLGDEESAAEHYRDLLDYTRDLDPRITDKSFLSFVATFDEPGLIDEVEYERLIWRHLQLMHDIDSRTYGVQAGSSSDPEQPNFGFHMGGHAFFIAGMHPGSSRATRRFSRPAMAITSNKQFMLLGEKFFSMQDKIRKREVENNGGVNPSFTHYEYTAPARHFSGRLTEKDWKCPYSSRHQATASLDKDQVLKRTS